MDRSATRLPSPAPRPLRGTCGGKVHSTTGIRGTTAWAFGTTIPTLGGSFRRTRRVWPRGSIHTLLLATTRSTDRKSTRLNSSHSQISYAVFCLKKKNQHQSTRIRRDGIRHLHYDDQIDVHNSVRTQRELVHRQYRHHSACR